MSLVLILISPLIVGGIIAAINTNSINDATEKTEAWIRRTETNVSAKSGWFYSYIIYPVVWTIVKFSDWTDAFTHRGIKNGVRVATTLYLIAAWCLLIYLAFMVVVVLVLGAVIIYIAFKVLINSNEDVKRGYERGRKIVGHTGSGKRINQETGVVQEKGMLGYNDTEQRINPETGKVQTKGMFGWNDTETRIDQETGNIQEKGMFGYNDTETRVNPDTGIIQKKGLIGWIDTEERINPETGKHQKKGLIGWSDD